MSFCRKIGIVIVSVCIMLAFFNSSKAAYIRNQEKAQIYMINLGQQSGLLSQALLNYIKIKEMLLENVDNEFDDARIQEDINTAQSMMRKITDYTSDISMISDYASDWDTGKAMYKKDLIIKDDDIKPITAIVLDVSNQKFYFQHKDEIMKLQNIAMFYSQNKPDIIYTDREIQEWSKGKEERKNAEEERIAREQEESKILEEAKATLSKLREEMGITQASDISGLSKQDIDKEISLLMKKKRQEAEEEQQQKIAMQKKEEEERKLDEEYRKANGLESIEQQKERIAKEKEHVKELGLAKFTLAAAIQFSGSVVSGLSGEKLTKDDTEAAKMILEEISQAEKICGANVTLKADAGQNTPCIDIMKRIYLMTKIWEKDSISW